MQPEENDAERGRSSEREPGLFPILFTRAVHAAVPADAE